MLNRLASQRAPLDKRRSHWMGGWRIYRADVRNGHYQMLIAQWIAHGTASISRIADTYESLFNVKGGTIFNLRWHVAIWSSHK